MTARSTPPDLPNYDFVRDLGEGGFADVYLYRQRLPSREVAVKVLRQRADTAADRSQFDNEANRMAMLSSHPGIVTIYEVGVTPDDRPFLTMEYCPNDHYGRIAKTETISVPRALEVGVKVSAAVAAAHGAGVLHRDIKPANILMTAYREPALTDFGIAGGRDGGTLAESQGVSIPFAAPEVLNGESAGDERADIYALAATVYALLAGRSPYGTGTTGDTDRAMIQRILSGTLPPLNRGDMPASLERVLSTAMARRPGDRFDSAAAFARALQAVEVELGLAPTNLQVAASAPSTRTSRDVDDEDGTRFRAPQRVDPTGAGPSAPIAGVPQQYASGSPTPAEMSLPVPEGPEDGNTIRVDRSAPSPDDVDPAPSTPERSFPLAVVIGAGVVLVVLVLAVVILGGGGSDPDETATTTTVDEDAFVLPQTPATPTDLTLERADAVVTISWTPVEPEAGDEYRVSDTGAEAAAQLLYQGTDATVTVESEAEICVQVVTLRSSAISEPTSETCG